MSKTSSLQYQPIGSKKRVGVSPAFHRMEKIINQYPGSANRKSLLHGLAQKKRRSIVSVW
ncbi:MAG: hypothetical protein JSU05_01245 [Bacteroidetes bacterium]|nr:hypothetical protein [Bacteroidota bacterium]